MYITLTTNIPIRIILAGTIRSQIALTDITEFILITEITGHTVTEQVAMAAAQGYISLIKTCYLYKANKHVMSFVNTHSDVQAKDKIPFACL